MEKKVKKHRLKKGVLALLLVYIIFSLFLQSAFAASGESAFALNENVGVSEAETEGVHISSRIWELLFGKSDNKESVRYLIPSGEVFGIKIKEENPTVASADASSPFKKGDVILSVNNCQIVEPEDIENALVGVKGNTVSVKIQRGGEPVTLTVKPREEDGKLRLGVTLRKSASGIGTITFIDPQTGIYGGLGHGVSDPDTGKPISLRMGIATKAILGRTKRGECGSPGELSGILSSDVIGSIEKNSTCGVFGILSEVKENKYAPIPVGTSGELALGEATVISTVKNGCRAEYKIEITEIDKSATGSKSFKIKVTDPTLITLTGGIVRGMSGSPIIQNGKLVGAVTHVMVNDPTEGYGIFIENMLNSIK